VYGDADLDGADMTRSLWSLGMILFLAGALNAQAQSTSVTGTVIDELGRPIREALVVIDAETAPARARTGPDGRFRVDGLPPGGHILQVVRIGFRPYRSTFTATASGVDIPVTLSAAPVLLDTIAVRVAQTGIHGVVATHGIALLPHPPRALRGAIIEVLNTPYRTTTGPDGRFSLGSLGEGAYSLLVRIDRYQSRVVSTYVPPEGGVDINIVLDSTIADWQRREDMELREISRRIREALNPSAFVSAAELVAPDGTSLRDAIRFAPSTLSRGLLLKDDVTCVYVNGDPRPGLTAADVLAEDILAVEVYGLNGRARTQIPMKPWPVGGFCGTGTRKGPLDRPELPPSVRPSRLEADNFARVIVIWTRRGR
jgi:hypothetical protein